MRSGKHRGVVRLHNCPQLQYSIQLAVSVLRRLVRGVSCRVYEQVVVTARAGFGFNRSSVSRAFIRSQTVNVRQFCQRRWENFGFAVIFIDGQAYAGQQLVARQALRLMAGSLSWACARAVVRMPKSSRSCWVI